MVVKIKNENRPSDTDLAAYLGDLHMFLAPLRATVRLDEYDHPIDIRSWINNVECDTERIWFGDFIVDTPELKGLKVRIFDPNFSNDPERKTRAWLQAYMIQGEIYLALKKDPGHPQNKDPYWELWDKNPSKI
jgi:hypothetical protein